MGKRLGRPPMDSADRGEPASFWAYAEQRANLDDIMEPDVAETLSEAVRVAIEWTAKRLATPGFSHATASRHLAATARGNGTDAKPLSTRLRQIDEDRIEAIIHKVWPPRTGIAAGIASDAELQSWAVRFAIRWTAEASRKKR